MKKQRNMTLPKEHNYSSVTDTEETNLWVLEKIFQNSDVKDMQENTGEYSKNSVKSGKLFMIWEIWQNSLKRNKIEIDFIKKKQIESFKLNTQSVILKIKLT